MYRKYRPPTKKSHFSHVCEICKVGCTSAAQLDEHFKGVKHRQREELITWTEEPPARKRKRSSSMFSDLRYSSYEDYYSYPDTSEPASSTFERSPRTKLSLRHRYTGRSLQKKRKIFPREEHIRDEEHHFHKQSNTSPTHSDYAHSAKEDPENEYSAIAASCDSSDSEDAPCSPEPEKKKEDINKTENCLPGYCDEDYTSSLLPLQSKEHMFIFLKNFEIADNTDVEFLTNVTQLFSKALKMYWTEALPYGNKECNMADLITEKESSFSEQAHNVNTDVDNALMENEIMECITAEAASSDDEGL